ncbi:MAG: glycosyltransferase family 2 protein [Chloroflexota bacterium]|nr:glycosyltransferase family 2 protein [Chloroflexota bacterium]
MLSGFLETLAVFIFYILFAFSILVALLAVVNLFFIRRASISDSLKTQSALVSILIPARNEEANIGRCLYSLIDQSYKNIEIIILDDDSTDYTFSIAKEISKKDKRIKIVKGMPIEKDWLGKNWACHQLSSIAKGDMLLFIDADTKLQSKTIEETITEMEESDIDLITLFPKRVTSTSVDKIISVTVGWFIFSCLPILFSNKNPIFSSAFGQYLLFRKGAYFSIGGHESIKDDILDDFELGRSITREGFNLKVFDGTDRISTFSYSSEREAIDGLSKSIFPFFSNRLVPFFLLWILFMAMSIVPVLVIFGDLFQIRLSRSKEVMAFLIWGSLTLSWVISSYRSKQGLLPGIFFPVVTTITAILGIFSVLSFLFNNVVWKDRNLSSEDDVANYEEVD